MRAKIFAAFIAAIVLVGLISGAAFAEKIITKVDVVNKADRAVIRVQGNTALSMMPFSMSRGTYLGFQFPFRLGDRGRLVPIHGGRINNVRYSNFKARPAITRFVVNTAGVVDYSTDWSPDKRRLEISVWKYGAAHKTLNRVQGDSRRVRGDSACHAELDSASDSASPLAASATKPVETVKVVSEPATARVPVRAATPAPLTEGSRKVYAALRAFGRSRAVASAVADQQQRITQPVVVASAAPVALPVEPAAISVVQGNPPVSPLCKGGRSDVSPLDKGGLRGVAPRRAPLSEESRKAYAALRTLGVNHKAATMVVAQQPTPAVKVAGMVESSPDVVVTVDPPKSATSEEDKNVKPTYRLDSKPIVVARASTSTSEPVNYRGSAKRVSLNFLGADINDVLKALSVQSGENIVASKDVKGEVTVSLSNVTIDEAMDYVAKLSGYGYAKNNGTYIVAAKDQLRLLGDNESEQGSAVEVVFVTYAKPQVIIDLLNKQFPSVSIIWNDDGLMSNTPDKNDKKASDSKADESSKKKNLTRGGQLVLSGPQIAVQLAADAARKIDSSIEAMQATLKTATYRVKYVKTAQLAMSLRALVPGVSISYGPSEGFHLDAPGEISVSSAGSRVARANQSDESNSTVTKMTMDTVHDPWTGLSYSAVPGKDDKTDSQTLIFMGREADLQRALSLATELDVRLPQVKIEAKVTSLNKSGEKKLGLSWDWGKLSYSEGSIARSSNNGSTSSNTSGSANGSTDNQYGGASTGTNADSHATGTGTSTTGSTTGSIASTITGAFTDTLTAVLGDGKFYRQPWNFTALLQAIVTSGNGKLLASPNLLCLEGKPGVFFVGDEVTYIQRIETTPTGQNILTDTKQVGVQLRVVADVSSDGYITLNLHPEVSVLKLNVQQGVSLPIVTRRFTDHVVRVKNGQTIVIGGLIRNDEIDEMSKVPFLGDLPFLGNLFRHKRTTRDETEVVMFITASILQD